MNAQEFGAQSFHDLPAEQAAPAAETADYPCYAVRRRKGSDVISVWHFASRRHETFLISGFDRWTTLSRHATLDEAIASGDASGFYWLSDGKVPNDLGGWAATLPQAAAKLQPIEQWDAETKAWVVRWVEVGQ